MLDLRLPSGLFFAALGLILLGVSMFMPDAHAPLTDANVNLDCGICMAVFGIFLLVMAKRAGRRQS